MSQSAPASQVIRLFDDHTRLDDGGLNATGMSIRTAENLASAVAQSISATHSSNPNKPSLDTSMPNVHDVAEDNSDVALLIPPAMSPFLWPSSSSTPKRSPSEDSPLQGTQNLHRETDSFGFALQIKCACTDFPPTSTIAAPGNAQTSGVGERFNLTEQSIELTMSEGARSSGNVYGSRKRQCLITHTSIPAASIVATSVLSKALPDEEVRSAQSNTGYT
ncbi:hypothetical protein K474DRAFT_949564 [Panus rudis PR-1116 ss-1]|nr:hypothetical protein K474DRAFT_949564 [Panus rudis PR-1116 ss-1]